MGFEEAMGMELSEIVVFLDKFLEIGNWEDRSMNGLQVEGKKTVRKIGFAVDASFETFKEAKSRNIDMIIVHHGLIWGGIDYIRGLISERLKILLKNDISLYAAHLPLDAHPEVGNNAQLIKLLGAEIEESFGEYRGKAIGFTGSFRSVIELNEVSDILSRNLNTNTKVLDFGKSKIKKIAAISGGGAFGVPEAADKGVDAFITGEPEHSAYHTAKESRLNVIFAGHYATETLGVRALMEVVRDKLIPEVYFIDLPTGL